MAPILLNWRKITKNQHGCLYETLKESEMIFVCDLCEPTLYSVQSQSSTHPLHVWGGSSCNSISKVTNSFPSINFLLGIHVTAYLQGQLTPYLECWGFNRTVTVGGVCDWTRGVACSVMKVSWGVEVVWARKRGEYKRVYLVLFPNRRRQRVQELISYSMHRVLCTD